MGFRKFYLFFAIIYLRLQNPNSFEGFISLFSFKGLSTPNFEEQIDDGFSIFEFQITCNTRHFVKKFSTKVIYSIAAYGCTVKNQPES